MSIIFQKYLVLFVPGANRRHPTWLTDESAELPTAKVATSERCRRPLGWTIGRLLGITMIPYSYVSHRIIRCNSSSIIIITTITINSIPISPSRTAWTLFTIDWRRDVPSSSNIRQRWSINSHMNSAKNSRPVTRDLALTKIITSTTSKIDIISGKETSGEETRLRTAQRRIIAAKCGSS